MRYGIGLGDNAVCNAASEGIADRVLIRVPAIRRKLRRTDDTLAQVLNEIVRGRAYMDEFAMQSRLRG